MSRVIWKPHTFIHTFLACSSLCMRVFYQWRQSAPVHRHDTARHLCRNHSLSGATRVCQDRPHEGSGSDGGGGCEGGGCGGCWRELTLDYYSLVCMCPSASGTCYTSMFHETSCFTVTSSRPGAQSWLLQYTLPSLRLRLVMESNSRVAKLHLPIMSLASYYYY